MRYVFAVSNDYYYDYLDKREVKNFLMSYAYKDNLLKVLDKYGPHLEKNQTMFLIDSGAFTVWTKGQTIDVKEYGDFLEKLQKDYPKINFRFISLDVIPGKFGQKPNQTDIDKSAQQGWDNYMYLKGRGLNVIHIFHQFEDEKWLHKLAASSDYIGISPANDRSIKSRVLWLRWVFSKIGTKVKAHGFGITAKSALQAVPFYSADSSTWIVGVRWGQVDDKDLHQLKAKYERNQEKLLNVGISNSLDLEDKVTRLWKKRGIVWKD